MIMIRSSIYACLLAVASTTATTVVNAAESEFCPTLDADFHRRQTASFGGEAVVYEEGTSAKHNPFLTLSADGKTGTIVVGNGEDGEGVWHPMVASEDPETVHFITHIMVKDQDDNVVALEALDPTVAAPATMTFSVPGGVTTLTPFEWCNKHGLYKGATVTIPAPTTVDPSDPSCGISNFDTQAWESVHADFMRLQKMEPHNSEVPFTEEGGVKHTPYITLNADGITASILVGDTSADVHPMNGSPDGESPHWITELYVMDQSGKIVTMQSLDSTGVDRATAEFNIPEGAETLQAYEWCNLHGLWQGPEVKVGSASDSSTTEGNSGVACSIAVGAIAGTSLLAAIGM
mmetsp:Transcript_7355/g.13369  ORF Transcript_7355/g.13369 Transcript_7355/m.13369 type:complete len:348 (+) Transcript_7355:147-1190(+)|eukprot:CAMPEP_0201628550 /NCGR_PEP_ID=MMETSP0493-20130528/3461_1 /ASSEMBLY_ACC=CAM_ASM_000838 /TAXON_ID=420259 /ORGANISM="Thalassiosira gravida, Strain GMp14c1" /LENGTH=347 /DNA_ID=CAMNT_0048099329 /DNA_START=115 /DNA_END=1158 /DNA_ORIENTATION=+